MESGNDKNVNVFVCKRHRKIGSSEFDDPMMCFEWTQISDAAILYVPLFNTTEKLYECLHENHYNIVDNITPRALRTAAS